MAVIPNKSFIPARERDPHPITLVLIAAVLIAAGAALLMLARTYDAADNLIGNPTGFARPPEAEPAAKPAQAQPAPAQPTSAQPQAPPASASGHVPGPAAGVSGPPEIITDIRTLSTASDPVALQGREVALRDVQVQDVAGDFVFWAGPDAESAQPVVLRGELTARQAESQVVVKPGHRVAVFGIVRVLAGSGVLETDKFLDDSEKERLRQNRVYISASRVVMER